MSKNPLRGIGPRTFISYCFQDKDIASRVRDFLSMAGFQVHMEDETSLLNTRLPDVLPRRIHDAECFVQLRTAVANNSYWVNQEFEYAEQRRARDEAFTLIPVVFDSATLSDRVRQWVYVDATAGLTEAPLSVIRDTGLASVRLARVDPTAPTLLVATDLVRLLAQPDSKRVILDGDGFWLGRMDEVLASVRSRPDIKGGAGFHEQEERRRERLVWLFARADAATAILARELNKRIHQSITSRDDAKRALDGFYGILFEHYLWPVAQHALAAKTIVLDDIAGLKKLGEPATLEDEANAMAWCMKPTLKERFRSIMLPGGDRMIKTGLDSATGKHSAYVYFPRDAIGSDWMTMLQVAPQPEALISEFDWAVFGLPQIAARAVGLTGRHNPETAVATFNEIDTGMGWMLQDYCQIGLP